MFRKFILMCHVYVLAITYIRMHAGSAGICMKQE